MERLTDQMSAFWLVFYSLKFGFQLLELALCVAFAALFFAYHQRRELATAWVQWFFGLEALIRGDAQIQVEWRGADDLADGDADKLGRVLRLARARLADGEFPVERLTCRARDVVLFAPGSNRKEEAVVADVLVLRARFPPKDAPPEDGDPRGEAFCALGVSLHTARVRVVSYDGGLSDTSLARVQKAVKEAFDARRRGARALTPEEAARADEIRRRDDVVAAVVVTDRRGNFVAQPYERAELAHYEFATATPVYACVLFERRRDGWRATATYGLDYACERIKRKARERGGPLERFRETETPAASQDEIRRLFGARWCKTESVTVGHLRVKAYDGAGRALSGHEATLSHMILEPSELATRLGAFSALNRIAIKALASTGMDALKSGVASAASVLDQGVEDLQHAGARAGGALGGPAEMLVLGTTDAARSVVHGAVDGAVEITSGIALGGKLAVTGLIHSAQDGDPGRFATSLVRASDEAVSGVLQGVAVAADGVHDGFGAVLDGVAAGVEYAPVVGDVLGGFVGAGKHVVGGVFGAARGAATGVARGAGAFARATLLDGDPLKGVADGGRVLGRDLVGGAHDLSGGLYAASEDVYTCVEFNHWFGRS